MNAARTRTHALTRPRTRTRRYLGGAALGLAPLVAVLLMAPTTLGATQSAPFKHLSLVKSNPVSITGCGTTHIVHPAVFNRTSGVGGFSDNATLPTCANSSMLYQEGSFTVGAPVHVKTTGVHNITVFWLTQANGTANITAGSCTGVASGGSYPNCNVSAAAFVYGTAYLLDKNTGVQTKLSGVWRGNSTYVWDYTYCYPAPIGCQSKTSKTFSSALHTGSSYWGWYWNGTTLNKTHNYTLKMTIFGGVKLTATTAQGATLSKAWAFAQLFSAPKNGQETLISISVS